MIQEYQCIQACWHTTIFKQIRRVDICYRAIRLERKTPDRLTSRVHFFEEVEFRISIATERRNCNFRSRKSRVYHAARD
jgi:hypothetical protein